MSGKRRCFLCSSCIEAGLLVHHGWKALFSPGLHHLWLASPCMHSPLTHLHVQPPPEWRYGIMDNLHITYLYIKNGWVCVCDFSLSDLVSTSSPEIVKIFFKRVPDYWSGARHLIINVPRVPMHLIHLVQKTNLKCFYYLPYPKSP